MFKRLKIAALVLIALALTVPAFALGTVRVESVRLPTEAPGLQFTCSYPHIFGIGNDKNGQKLNTLLREQAQSAQKAAQYAALQAPAQGSFGFEVTRNQSGVVSLVTVSTLTQNGKTLAARRGLTADTATGAVYTLPNLFGQDADYVGVLSDQVRAQIQSKGLTNKQRQPFKQIDRFQDFYLTNGELVLIFPQNTCFTADCGVQEFRLSLQSLDGTLRPAFRQ